MDKYIITIKLISDLCSNSGSSLGSSVDTAVMLDESRKPFIPAKRLKGLMLEAYLDYLDLAGEDSSKAEQHFGETESDNSRCYVSNASIIEKDGEYTYNRTQTRVGDDGVAQDGSLRTMMVVKANNRFTFTFETSMGESELKKTLKLIRHIGTNRTRGLGEVEFTAEKLEESKKAPSVSLPDTGEATIRVYVTNDQPLLLATINKESDTYITGTTLLGYFANKHINEHGVDNFFKEAFVNGGLRFSNGYLSDAATCSVYYPFPSYLRLEKANGNSGPRVFNTLYPMSNAGQSNEVKTKSLENTYGCIKGGVLTKKSPEYSIIYHHSRNKDNMSDGEIEAFYQYSPLSSGQTFSFTISGDVKYLKEVVSGLKEVRIGKARTAGYGHAEVTKVELVSTNNKTVKGKELVIECLSPLAVMNENGDYTTTREEVVSYLERKLGVTIVDIKASQLTPLMVSGFSTVWLKQKPSFEAIDKGSYLFVEFDKEVELHVELTIGQKQAEGLGHIAIKTIGEETYSLAKRASSINVEPAKPSKIIAAAYKNADIAYKNVFKGHSSFAGRVRSMFEESTLYNNDFTYRIDSIKNSSNKEDDRNRAKKVYEYVLTQFEEVFTTPASQEANYKEYFRYLFGIVQGKLKKEDR